MLKKTGWFILSLLLSLFVMGIGIFILALFLRETVCTQQAAERLFAVLRAVSLLAGLMLLCSRLHSHGARNGFLFSLAAEACRIALFLACGEAPFVLAWWKDILLCLFTGVCGGILFVNLFSFAEILHNRNKKMKKPESLR